MAQAAADRLARDGSCHVVWRATAGGPDDVARRDAVVERRDFLVVGKLKYKLCRPGPDRVEVLTNARERRGRQGSCLRVVKADDRLFAGKHKARSFQDPHDSDGVVIGRGENRRRGEARREHGLTSLGAAALDIICRLEQQAVVGLHAVACEGLAVSLVAFPYVALSQVAHKGNSAMPVTHEMIDR